MKFRKKPVVIEAIQWSGRNYEEVMAFTESQPNIAKQFDSSDFIIPTLEGEMKASKGDWIIKGIQGEFYPCKPDIFEKTYDPTQSEVEEIAFTEQEIELDQILKYFSYLHLPVHLREVSSLFAKLAKSIVDTIPSNRRNEAERTIALRKLLESKDAAVRANLDANNS